MSWVAVAIGGSAVLGAGATIYGANKAGDQVSDAATGAAKIQDRLARDVLGINLTAGIPSYAAGNTALAGMMDMMGLDRSLIPTSAGAGAGAGGQGADPRANRPYPPPPNWYRQPHENWVALVDEWYANPAKVRAEHPGAADYITNSTNDFYQGLQENWNGDNVATLIDPATGLPKPYGYGDTGSGSGFDTSQLTAAADILGTAPKYNWQTSPGYEFRFNEGVRAIDQSAVAGGGAMSGGALKELTRYGQEYGSAEFDKIFNRLGMLAGFNVSGSSAISGGAGQYGQIGSGVADAYYAGGASRASATIAGTNAVSNLFGQGAMALGWLGANRPSGSPGGDDFNWNVKWTGG